MDLCLQLFIHAVSIGSNRRLKRSYSNMPPTGPCKPIPHGSTPRDSDLRLRRRFSFPRPGHAAPPSSPGASPERRGAPVATPDRAAILMLTHRDPLASGHGARSAQRGACSSPATSSRQSPAVPPLTPVPAMTILIDSSSSCSCPRPRSSRCSLQPDVSPAPAMGPAARARVVDHGTCAVALPSPPPRSWSSRS